MDTKLAVIQVIHPAPNSEFHQGEEKSTHFPFGSLLCPCGQSKGFTAVASWLELL
jgi:hypothetical protein